MCSSSCCIYVRKFSPMSPAVSGVEVDKNLELQTLTPRNSGTDGRAEPGFERKVHVHGPSVPVEFERSVLTTSGVKPRRKSQHSNRRTGSGRGRSDFRSMPKDASVVGARSREISARSHRNRRDGDVFRGPSPIPSSQCIGFVNSGVVI